jgi:choline dehydrogenase-like flavoprotein
MKRKQALQLDSRLSSGWPLDHVGRQTYRYSEMDLSQNARDGHGVDWPIRYADLAPWYDKVETFIGVSGENEGLPQLPDGKFLPVTPMTDGKAVQGGG